MTGQSHIQECKQQQALHGTLKVVVLGKRRRIEKIIIKE